MEFLKMNSSQYNGSSIRPNQIYEEEPKNQKGTIDRLLVSIVGLSSHKSSIVEPIYRKIYAIENFVKSI